MAVRVENAAAINFGTVADATVVVTHFRVRKGSVDMIVETVKNDRTFVVGDVIRLPAGELDLIYKVGNMENAGMNAMVTGYFNSMLVDAMTSASAVVSDSGYSQQTVNTAGWTKTNEADS